MPISKQVEPEAEESPTVDNFLTEAELVSAFLSTISNESERTQEKKITKTSIVRSNRHGPYSSFGRSSHRLEPGHPTKR